MTNDMEWQQVGRLDDIPKLGARVVRTPDGDVALFRTADDQLFALRNRCPHKGGPLAEGIVFGHRVACPLHNWAIDLESGVAVPPDEGCVGRYPVRLEGREIYLSLAVVDGAETCG